MVSEGPVGPGDFAGDWMETIPADRGEPEKTDLVHCRQAGGRVEGKIERQWPKNQAHKKWGFRGSVEGRALFCVYWPTNQVGAHGSYGSIQLMNGGEDCWAGFYVRLPHAQDANGAAKQGFEQFSLTWQLQARRPSTFRERRS